MAAAAPGAAWRAAGYSGDVAALAVVDAPAAAAAAACSGGGSWGAARGEAWVLAGVGGEVRVHGAVSGALASIAQVLRGVRIYGIRAGRPHSVAGEDALHAPIALHGGRLVRTGALDCSSGVLALRPGLCLRSSEWVMDVALVSGAPRADGCPAELAVGLSDNSVELWDVTAREPVLKRRIECTERRLLYCMAFHRPVVSALEELRVASGTVWDEIVLWAPHIGAQAPRARLKGHGGSIMRVAWEDARESAAVGGGAASRGDVGSGPRWLASVSDDRTARVWDTRCWDDAEGVETGEGSCADVRATRVLHGHKGRVWDCVFIGGALLTAAEDRTVRVWDIAAGAQAAEMRGHVGRGVWRLAGSRALGTVASGGADGTVKLWPLEEHVTSDLLSSSLTDSAGNDAMDIDPEPRTARSGKRKHDQAESEPAVASAGFDASEFDMPGATKQNWMRDLVLAQGGRLVLVASNEGYVHALELPTARVQSQSAELAGADEQAEAGVSKGRWVQVHRVVEAQTGAPVPVISISAHDRTDGSARVAIGDMRGGATVLDLSPALEVSGVRSWVAHAQKLVVSMVWPASFGGQALLTAEGVGVMKLWDLHSSSISDARAGADVSSTADSTVAALRCTMAVPSTIRTHCCEVSKDGSELICGDQRGNVFIFRLPAGPTSATASTSLDKISSGATTLSPSIILSHAHAKESVSFVRLLPGGAAMSAGRDGLTVWYERIAAEAASDGIETLRPVRSRRLQTMTSLQALVPLHANEVDASGERSSVGHVDEELACGFLGDEWIAVCVEGSREITRVTCGGWKRPYDMHVAAGRRGGRKLDPRSAGGLEPAVRLAFAFLRGGKVHVHRTRPPRALAWGPLSIPRRTLFPEGHGLEAHSCEMLDAPNTSRSTSGAWLVTASEDGSVRASLVDILAQPTMPCSFLLGDRGNGATLRCVAKGALAPSPSDAMRHHQLVFGVGSRYSLMAWDIAWRHEGERPAPWAHLAASAAGDGRVAPFDVRSLGSCPNHVAACIAPPRSSKEAKRGAIDDHRFKSVAVLGGGAGGSGGGKSEVVTVAVGAADATLTLIAFDPISRRWATGARLCHHHCPVLSVVALPGGYARSSHSGGAGESRHPASGWLASAATDGVLAVWDCRGVVHGAEGMVRVSAEQTAADWQPPAELGPALLVPGAHQSGVNCMTALPVGPREVAIVSGGDDQALHVALVRFGDATGGESEARAVLVAECRVESAHTSQVLGVCPFGERGVLTTGLDQRFVAWEIVASAEGVELRRTQTLLTEVVDVDDVAVAPLAADGAAVAAVVGRGVEVLALGA